MSDHGRHSHDGITCFLLKVWCNEPDAIWAILRARWKYWPSAQIRSPLSWVSRLNKTWLVDLYGVFFVCTFLNYRHSKASSFLNQPGFDGAVVIGKVPGASCCCTSLWRPPRFTRRWHGAPWHSFQTTPVFVGGQFVGSYLQIGAWAAP